MGSVIHQPSRVGPLSAAAASVAMQAPEQLFHPLILPFAHFEIVRRVQVQQGERFDGALASKALPWITSSRVVRASKALCESSSTPYRSERLFSVIATNAAPVPAQGSRTLTGSSGNCKSFVSVGLRDCPTDSIQPISHLSIVELESVFAIKIRTIKRPWTSPVGGSAPIWPSSA